MASIVDSDNDGVEFATPTTSVNSSPNHKCSLRDDEIPNVHPSKFRQRRSRSLYGASPNCYFGPKGRIMKNSANTLTIQDPGSQRLTWYNVPKTTLIIKKIFDDTVWQPFKDIATWLVKEKNMTVYVEEKVMEEPNVINDNEFRALANQLSTFQEGKEDLTDKIDFIICLGGDGTLLYASSLFQQSVPPVMAFHLGSLGFLTPHQFTMFREQITQVLEGNAALTLRSRLKCVVHKLAIDGPDMFEREKSPETHHHHHTSKKHIMVLNEVVVDRGPCPYLCNVDLYMDGRHVTSVQGDGLIISTPTGSTAYAAAAGASMIHPNVPAILICPICPHSLSFRPIVVPAGVEVKIMVNPDARNSAWVSFDGRNRQEITSGDCVRITTSIYPVPSICSQDQIRDWFDSLAECLHWNVRRQQNSFSRTSTSTYSLESLDLSNNGDSDSPTDSNTFSPGFSTSR
ncbi:unnamed protein product [Owenia fusiformis]|uniref:NAD(+) kinase n=1 Tax=Owenia fusiformis TaxID=6347 RepID=A0A8J1UX35_OWEFU|nr:unnamed protein product [Owenia fusiformis]